MASTSQTVRVDGLRRLRSDLRKIEPKALDNVKRAYAAAAAMVAAAASARAPKRSGRLAASVRGNRAVSRATVAAGGVTLPYAGPIHYGWPAHNIEAAPFIIDAAQATEPAWLPIFAADVDQALDVVRGHTY
jgi:hypothetical protein